MTTVNRLATLARAEWLQFRRNKVILFMAIVIPLGMPLLMWLNLGPDSGTDKQLVGAGMMELYLMMSLLMVLFYSVLSMATTRRDEGVLNLDDANVLKVTPFTDMGSVVQLINAFGGKAGFEKAVHELQDALYQETA